MCGMRYANAKIRSAGTLLGPSLPPSKSGNSASGFQRVQGKPGPGVSKLQLVFRVAPPRPAPLNKRHVHELFERVGRSSGNEQVSFLGPLWLSSCSRPKLRERTGLFSRTPVVVIMLSSSLAVVESAVCVNRHHGHHGRHRHRHHIPQHRTRQSTNNSEIAIISTIKPPAATAATQRQRTKQASKSSTNHSVSEASSSPSLSGPPKAALEIFGARLLCTGTRGERSA